MSLRGLAHRMVRLGAVELHSWMALGAHRRVHVGTGLHVGEAHGVRVAVHGSLFEEVRTLWVQDAEEHSCGLMEGLCLVGTDTVLVAQHPAQNKQHGVT